jgi:hypothetical protein
MVKYATLGTLSFIVIIAMYDLLVKRGSLLRFMFGMKSSLVERGWTVAGR